MSLVTIFGGSGFIGRSLIRRLTDSGHHIRVVSRRAGASSGLVTFVSGDIADAASVDAAVRGADTVVLLVTGGGARWADFERDVVRGTRSVIEACERHHVGRVLYTSSIAALYLGAGGSIDESAGCDPYPDRRSLYSRGKIAAERVVRDGSVPWVILRPGVVMGREGVLNHAGLGMWPSDLCCIGYSHGTNPLPFVLVDDVAAALAAAIDAPVEGETFNLAGDVFMSAREFIDIVCQQSLRRFRFYATSPARTQSIDVAKWLIKIAARKQENFFPSYRDLLSNSLATQLDCSRAKTLLGWSPNADPLVFVQEAITPHLAPIPAGDLRLSMA